MKLRDSFKNVFTYASGIEKWCKDFYYNMSGNKLNYTFCADFAIADWYGEKDLKESYNRIKKSWISDYKAFTEVAISLNTLSWANDQLMKQGIDGREKYIELYSELWYQAKDDFYEKYSGNDEACDYFFNMTD
jgi:hypothetical protein